MKTRLLSILLLSFVVFVWSCGQKSHDDHSEHEHSHDQAGTGGANEALYSEVMKIHDETMIKMNDIYALKQALNIKLADSAKLDDAKKAEIKATLAELDSAHEGMMVWMREFSPIPDSLGEEKAREYLETEMEKVKNVESAINEAVNHASTLK